MDKFTLEEPNDSRIEFGFNRNGNPQWCPFTVEDMYCGSWCPFFEVRTDKEGSYIQLNCVTNPRIIEITKEESK